jgi:hypothetical protein
MTDFFTLLVSWEFRCGISELCGARGFKRVQELNWNPTNLKFRWLCQKSFVHFLVSIHVCEISLTRGWKEILLCVWRKPFLCQDPICLTFDLFHLKSIKIHSCHGIIENMCTLKINRNEIGKPLHYSINPSLTLQLEVNQ